MSWPDVGPEAAGDACVGERHQDERKEVESDEQEELVARLTLVGPRRSTRGQHQRELLRPFAMKVENDDVGQQENERDEPDDGDASLRPERRALTPKRMADGVVTLDGDERQSQHGHRHRHSLCKSSVKRSV